MRCNSVLEKRKSTYLKKIKIKFEDEKRRIKWQDLRFKTYTPDVVLDNGIIIETKGRFIHSDRTKHLMVKAQHPEHDIRFVFSNPAAKLYKGSKTTYGDWCTKNGFKLAKEIIPVEWTKEKKKGS